MLEQGSQQKQTPAQTGALLNGGDGHPKAAQTHIVGRNTWSPAQKTSLLGTDPLQGQDQPPDAPAKRYHFNALPGFPRTHERINFRGKEPQAKYSDRCAAPLPVDLPALSEKT